jgi:hypothetical protein
MKSPYLFRTRFFRFTTSLVLCSSVPLSAAMAQSDDTANYYSIKEMGIERLSTPESFKAAISSKLKLQNQDELPPLTTEINFDQIMNIGKQLWDLILKSRAVANIKFDYANALPEGVTSAMQLEGFSPLQFRSFKLWAKNYFGTEVYQVTYAIVHRFGGSVDGRGQYLDAVAVVPQKVDVLWGYSLDFVVNRVATSNVGTKAQPVASMLFDAQLRVSNPLHVSERRLLYEFRGDRASVTEVH